MTFNIEIEFVRRAADITEDAIDTILEQYASLRGSTTTSPRGRLAVICSVDAPNLRHAINVALGATDETVLSIEAMSSNEFDRRVNQAANQPLPELVSLAEAAEKLGVSKQAVHYRIDSGSLPARRVGNAWVLRADDVTPATR